MDWNYINTLLSVIHQAAAAGGQYKEIVALANGELKAYMAQPPVEEAEVGAADEPEPTTNGRRM